MTQTSIPQTQPSSSHNPDLPPRPDSGAPSTSGRGPNGRFAKGNPGGPGNPFARQVAAMRQEFFAAATKEDIAAIARAMIDKAKAGDVAAARIVLQYTLGKPVETVDPDRLDEMEWQQWQREQATGAADEVWTGLHATTANTIARVIVPAMQTEHFGELKRQMDDREEERREEAEEDQREAARQAERRARRVQKQSAPAEVPPAPSPKEEPAKPPRTEVQTPREAQPSVIVSPIEVPKAEEAGKKASPTAREQAAERALPMLRSTVNKREETARRAANDFVE